MAPTKAKLRFDRRHGAHRPDRIAHALVGHGAIDNALVRKGARHDTLPPGVTVVAVDFAEPACLTAA
ncbi:hypothetical protein ASE72_17445 [Sphingomonas sp. Leaf20]|nr:hypothetical protein ASE72_17445 [Sphingomonas sp. Leaf20]